MKVLINAYACSPIRGSEPGIGWYWSTEIAKYCQVIVITEGEYQNEIEDGLLSLPQKNNIRFIYNNVTERVRLMCKNQGDWRFYWYYRKWQYKTLEIAKDICQKEQIDIIHHLNMQGFREPGLLWRIEGPKFVWGPIGGVENLPLSYLKGANLRLKLFCTTKNIINKIQFLYQPNVYKAFRCADALVSSTVGTKLLIKKFHHKDSVLINDTGCDASVYKCNNEKFNKDGFFHLMWVGKFDFRKQLGMALKVVANLQDIKVKLHILGSGDQSLYMKVAADLGITDRCIWYGQVDHNEVNTCMQKADLFFFTSVHEATSTVIVEAIQNHLPIVCHDACGFGAVVSESIGIKVPITTPEGSITGFSDAIRKLYYNPSELSLMSSNCVNVIKELSWGRKAETMMDIYHQILDNSSIND